MKEEMACWKKHGLPALGGVWGRRGYVLQLLAVLGGPDCYEYDFGCTSSH